jgi:DNA-binding LytR/AlgR family response regulator
MTDNSIKILIVEDEMIIGAKVSMFLTELGYEVTGIFPRAEDVLLQLEESTPDIALLDINLKGSMDGIALAHVLLSAHQIPVIFLTANSDEATFQRAKEAKPYAFLSKPFKKLDLQRALELTIRLMSNAQTTAARKDPDSDEETPYILKDRIFVRNKDKMVKILFEDILYIEADRNYCRIYTKSKEYLLTMPMKSLEDQLPVELFQRIHRSHIVNLTQVDEVDENAVFIGEKPLPLSKSLREDFLSRIRTV